MKISLKYIVFGLIALYLVFPDHFKNMFKKGKNSEGTDIPPSGHSDQGTSSHNRP